MTRALVHAGKKMYCNTSLQHSVVNSFRKLEKSVKLGTAILMQYCFLHVDLTSQWAIIFHLFFPC
jgi:hypothetical protein